MFDMFQARGDSVETARQMSASGGLQTSLVGTPSLASITDSQPTTGQAIAPLSGDNHLHSHEGEGSPSFSRTPAAVSDSAAESSSTEATGSRQLEATFATDVVCVITHFYFLPLLLPISPLMLRRIEF